MVIICHQVCQFSSSDLYLLMNWAQYPENIMFGVECQSIQSGFNLDRLDPTFHQPLQYLLQ